MGICAANMRECDVKAKCYFGPNEGKAYNPSNPCCGFGTFNPATCDCEDGCYDETVVLDVTYAAVVYQPDKFFCGQNVCNVDCDDRGIMRNCGIITDTFRVTVPAGQCLKVNPVLLSDPRFPDICGELPPGWGEYNKYVEFYVCPPSIEPEQLGCNIATNSINPAGCFAGFTYTYSVEVVEQP